MDRNKKSENIPGRKENMESKIPKSAKSSTTKATSSKISQKETTKNLKRTVKIDTISSSKGKQMQTTNLQKSVKPMSIAKITKDVMNHFETEDPKLDNLASECGPRITAQEKQNTTKRVPLKEKYSQTSQKTSGILSKKPSASDFKPCTAFGGMRFNSKKTTTRQKSDMFQEITKDTKRDHQTANPPEPAVAEETEFSTKELKTTASAKSLVDKGIERTNEENLENLPFTEAKSSKATSLNMREAALKKCLAFGGIRFAPKWQSTPLKPDLFGNMQNNSKHDDKKMCSSDTPDSTKAISGKQAEIANATAGETFPSPFEEAVFFKPASNMMRETSLNVCTAFAGIRFTPKRKSTFKKPDIFDRERKESEIDDTEVKEISYAEKTIVATEIQHSHVGKSKQFSTEMARCTETVSITTKESNRIAAFEGIRFAPRVRSPSVKSNIFDSTQKESKTEALEPQLTNFPVKELKKIPDTSKALTKTETQHFNAEKLSASTIVKAESSKIHIEKNVKEVIAKPCSAFGGLRFKPRQKNLKDIFEV